MWLYFVVSVMAGSPRHTIHSARLVPGCSGVSYGSFCASLAGIPASVVERGRECSQLLARYVPPMPLFEDGEDNASTREGTRAMHVARAVRRPYRDPFVMCDKIVKKFMTMDVTAPDARAFLEDVVRQAVN